MKIIVASTLLLCASVVAANAESFTFKSTTHTVNSIIVSDGMAAPLGAVFGEGLGVTTEASGKTSNSTSSCASWTTPPGGLFTLSGVCTFSDNAKDQASIAFSCQTDMKTNVGDCWGGLRGISGRYQGKTGTISWHQQGGPDGKTGTAVGVGMWND
jgi:hypothetical protein